MSANTLQRQDLDFADDPVIQKSHQEQEARLRAMQPDNWDRPPVPRAPCLRVKSTGEILPWTEYFAARPDLCEACDVDGNTDPASWGAGAEPVSAPTEPRINVQAPPRSDSPDFTPLREAGLPEAFTRDYTAPELTKRDALTLPAQDAPGLTVDSVVAAVFASRA